MTILQNDGVWVVVMVVLPSSRYGNTKFTPATKWKEKIMLVPCKKNVPWCLAIVN